MWTGYDEDLSQNDFFKEIKRNHEDILKKASKEYWIICVPRSGSFKSEDISMTVILDHILIQTCERNYCTLNKKQVCLENHCLKLDQNNIFYNDIEVLFEETHYVAQTEKYLVWCVSWPLFLPQNQKHYSNNNVILNSLQDCIDFLYSEAFNYQLLESIQKLSTDFWKSHENSFEIESLQSQKDFLGNLYSQCLQLCFKIDIVKDNCEKNLAYLNNFKIVIETYMQYCLGKKLVYSINTLCHLTDSVVNKIVRNTSDIKLSDLNLPNEFNNLVIDAQFELSRLNNFVTVLDKMNCLSRTFKIFSNAPLQNDRTFYMTSDDFLQILVYLILKSDISNWFANLTFIKEYRFATYGSSDHTHFLVTTLEAAIAFIRSNQFLVIKQSINNFHCNNSSVITDLYETLSEKRDLVQINELLASGKEHYRAELCHPLCTCSNCENIETKEINRNLYTVVNHYNQNFLILACIENNINFMEFLLSLNYDLNFRDIFGKTALHYAAEKGYQDVLLLLINAKVNVNSLDSDRNTALHLACDKGHDNCVKALIYSSNLVEVNLQNIYGETPLFLATKWGHFDIIKILLEHGTSVCVKNNRHMSVYSLSPNYYITKLFKQFGCLKSNNIIEEVKKDTSRKSFENTLDMREDYLHNVSNCVQRKGVLFGTKPKSTFERKKLELLLKAIENNDMPLTCFYLGYSSDFHEEYNNKNIKTCHPLCACTNCSQIVDSCNTIDNTVENRTYKFNVNLCNEEGFTPLHVAAKFGRTEILRLLLDGGAFLNICVNKTFYTPLHFAVMFQRVQTVKELLKCGNCNVDAQDFKGNTPLYYACICNSNNLKIIEFLLHNGADCQKKNFKGKTVLQVCEEKNVFRICRILRESMGYISSKTKDYSPLGNSYDDSDEGFKFL